MSIVEKSLGEEMLALIDRTVALHPRIQAMRDEARETFLRLGLPENKAEEFRHTPIARLLQKNLKLDAQSSASVSAPKSEDLIIPGLDAHAIVIVNGVYNPDLSSINTASGIEIKSLSEAVDNGDTQVLEHIGKYADHAQDGFSAWNAAAWSNGVYVRIADNTVIDKPVLIHYWHDATNGQVITTNRNLFFIGRSSEVTIIEKYSSAGNSNHFSNNVTEAVVSDNAALNLYTIQHDAGNRYQYALTQIYQQNASRVNTFTFTLSGKLVRNNLQLTLDGEGIESHMFGLYLISGDTLADNHTVVDHRKPNSFSNEIYKGIMDGSSRGVFNGKIYVRPHAQKTNAFQANRNILLADSATVNTKPQLEIWADDVKCSHGCTTGQLDEEAMFYLQTRGIEKETARAMMLYAFATEILNNVKHPELKAYFDRLVSERLHKNF
ncbi:MAG TPA: Fe-S cluster assembly protein SufD [Chryseolinea sp.]|nr:Fe-S cluster assembly protein SufD [Chryseolinea sp.]